MRNAYAHVSVASNSTRHQVYQGVILVLMPISTLGTQGDSCECAFSHTVYEHVSMHATYVQ